MFTPTRGHLSSAPWDAAAWPPQFLNPCPLDSASQDTALFQALSPRYSASFSTQELLGGPNPGRKDLGVRRSQLLAIRRPNNQLVCLFKGSQGAQVWSQDLLLLGAVAPLLARWPPREQGSRLAVVSHAVSPIACCNEVPGSEPSSPWVTPGDDSLFLNYQW